MHDVYSNITILAYHKNSMLNVQNYFLHTKFFDVIVEVFIVVLLSLCKQIIENFKKIN